MTYGARSQKIHFLHPTSPLLAFEWTDPNTQVIGQYTWTALPQVFQDSLHIFG